MNLIKGDCLEQMDILIDKGVQVDAIITDPPYGTTACKWDSVIPFQSMWNRLNKLIKPNGAIVLFGSEPFSSALRMSNIKNYKYDWVWEKGKASNFLLAKKQPLKNHENVIIFNSNVYNYQSKELTENGKKRNNRARNATFNNKESIYGDIAKLAVLKYTNKKTGYPKSVIKFNSEANNQYKKPVFHPTQKPVALMEYLIKTYTNENETVLDFTMGSGTTGVACVNTNRKFIGIELDDKYFKIAEDRINEAIYEKANDLFNKVT